MAQRRTKIEVLNEKISKVDSKIAACTEKIAALEDEKTALAAQLDEIRKAEKKGKGSCRTETSAQADAQKRHFRRRSGSHDLQGSMKQILNKQKTGLRRIFSSKPVFL